MNSPLRTSAFHVLGLPADAEPREVYRQEQRLQVQLEMGKVLQNHAFPFAVAADLGRESVLSAVARLETVESRIREEVFWVHELTGKLTIRGVPPEDVLCKLKAEQGRNTTTGAVASHNLAVVLMHQALGASGGKRADYWKDALSQWQRVLSAATFWQFIQDRAASLSTDWHFDESGIKEFVRSRLSEAIIDEIHYAVRQERRRELPILLAAASAHRDWLPLDAQLTACADEVAGSLVSPLGSILDEIGRLDTASPKDAVRRTLASAERTIEEVARSLESALQPFGRWAGPDWTTLRAVGLKKLSIVYFNLLDDYDSALRLIVAAKNCTRDTELLLQLDQDWKHVQQTVLTHEAVQLIKVGQYDAAEAKLRSAMPLATNEQTPHITELLDACKFGRAFRGVDKTKTSPTLHTINGIGTTFYGRRNFDAATSTYTTTQWFVALFVPVFPIASYRVADTGGNSYRIYGRLPLSPFLSRYRWGVAAALIILIIAAFVSSDESGATTRSSSSSPSISSRYPTDSTASSPVTFGQGLSASSGLDERSEIEHERSALNQVSADLDRRKADLKAEGDELDQLKARLSETKATYTEDTIPENVRQDFNQSVEEYNRKVPSFNRALRQYNSDVNDFERRREAFNQRVHRYNAK